MARQQVMVHLTAAQALRREKLGSACGQGSRCLWTKLPGGCCWSICHGQKASGG